MTSTNLKNIDKTKLSIKDAIVSKEEYIGWIDKNKNNGGRIDVLIKFTNPNYLIVIENKIDAGDQEKQLKRYYNYAKKKDYTIFYLTKYGHEPSIWSTGKNLKEHYWTNISYKKDIKQWLEKCICNSSDNYTVQETIKQYIGLIDIITDQEINMKENMDLLKKIYSSNLYNEAKELYEIWSKKDFLIAEIIEEKIGKNNQWQRNIDSYEVQSTIFKNLDYNYKNSPIYLFFEPTSCQIGFYCKVGFSKKIEKNLEQILNHLDFQYIDKTTKPYETGDVWYLIDFKFKEFNEKMPTKQTIDCDYYNDINSALETIESFFKGFFS